MGQKNTILEVGPLSVPVSLEKISVRRDVHLDRASKDGNKIKRQEIDALTGEQVWPSDVQRGVFENAKDGTGFRAIDPAELEAIEEATQIGSFTVEQFVPLSEVPFERAQAAYFLAPQKDTGSAKPLKLLYEALKKSRKAGVLKITLTSRQYAAVIYAKDGGVILNTLAFASDFTKVARAAEALDGVKIENKAMVSLMTEFIDTLTVGREAVDEMEDDLVAARQALVDAALSGKKIPRSKKAPSKLPVEPDALEAQLRESVEQAKAKRDKTSSGKGRQPTAVG